MKRKKKTIVYICMDLSEIPAQLPWFIILRKSITKAKLAAMEPRVMRKEKSLSDMKW